ncbi:hypothetical protein V6N13_057428 [Hibiscus sabdariffa]
MRFVVMEILVEEWLGGVWRRCWWRYRRKEAQNSSFMSFRGWLWRFPRGLTAESMGRGEAAGEAVGRPDISCMLRMERLARGDNWAMWHSRADLAGNDPVRFGNSISEFGGSKRSVLVSRILGLIRSVLVRRILGPIRSILIRRILRSIRSILVKRILGLIRGVLGSYSGELKRCVLRIVTVQVVGRRVKRRVWDYYLLVLSRWSSGLEVWVLVRRTLVFVSMIGAKLGLELYFMRPLFLEVLLKSWGCVDPQEIMVDSFRARPGDRMFGVILVGRWMYNREDSKSGLFFVFVQRELVRRGWLVEGYVVVCCSWVDDMVAGMRVGSPQKNTRKRVGGMLTEGWLWWLEWNVFLEVWTALWWRFWRKFVQTLRSGDFEWWLWRFSRGSIVESRGREEANGEVVDKSALKCLTGVVGVRTWGYLRECLGPKRQLSSGIVVQRGTFPRVCARIGGATRIWPSGKSRRLFCLMIRYVCGCRVIGLKRSALGERIQVSIRGALDNQSQGLIRCVWGGRFQRLEWGKLGGYYCVMKWCGLKSVDIGRMKRCVLIVDGRGMKRCVDESPMAVLKRGAFGVYQTRAIRYVFGVHQVRLLRCVFGDYQTRATRCIFGVDLLRGIRCIFGNSQLREIRCVFVSKYCLTDGCILVTDSTFRAQLGIIWCFQSKFGSEYPSMAEEVAKLMSNLNFSEEEMIEMELVEGIGQEQQAETRKWVVAKLFTMRKFGEWLRVSLIRKRNGFQGLKRQGIVYTDKEMGGFGRGKQPEGNMPTGPRGGGRGQQGNGAFIRPRGPKRVLQGKYEVCTPVGTKKARSASSSLVVEDDGNLEVMSPLKTTSTVEAVEQPRREP